MQVVVPAEGGRRRRALVARGRRRGRRRALRLLLVSAAQVPQPRLAPPTSFLSSLYRTRLPITSNITGIIVFFSIY